MQHSTKAYTIAIRRKTPLRIYQKQPKAGRMGKRKACIRSVIWSNSIPVRRAPSYPSWPLLEATLEAFKTTALRDVVAFQNSRCCHICEAV